jgi:pimeloyl-ACP methyl ester carboxylesterase
MRAVLPVTSGYADSGGVPVHYEVYGDGPRTVLLMPTWEIVHSRCWKLQVPYLSRYARVVTFDPRGNGRSGRPRSYDAYTRPVLAADALAILDLVGVRRATVVTWCDMGEGLLLTATHPDRVDGLVLITPPLEVGTRTPAPYSFDDVLDTDQGWAKENRHYWMRDWRGYLEHFFTECLPEPHSTKPIEDCVGWGLETDAETILTGFRGWDDKELDPATVVSLCAEVRCPVLVVRGTQDRLVGPGTATRLAAALNADLIELDGSGHAPHARDPVRINHILRDFLDRIP